MAAQLAVEFPALLFRNPDVLTQAWEQQAATGVGSWTTSAPLDELFGDPELIRNGHYRTTLSTYLRDETVSPVLFHRLGQRHPDTVSVVFRKLLGKRTFDWNRDGEALLRKHKSAHLDRTPLPTVVPLSEKLVAAATGRRASRPRRARPPRAGRFYQPALLDDPQLIGATP